MRFAQGRLIRLVSPWLGPGLITPAGVEAIAQFADHLPDAFTWGILELRLAAGDARVDLELCASRFDGSPSALAEAFAAPASAARARFAFGALCPLLQAWAAGADRLAEMPRLFLEYDEPARGDRAPFAFLATDQDPHAARLASADAIALARAGLAQVPGGLDTSSFETWQRCLHALPPDGRALTLASLHARGMRALRLDALLPRPQIATWFDAIEWPGDRKQLDELFALIGPGFSRHRLQLDLGETVGPNLGVLYRPAVAPHAPGSWHALFDQLCTLGACTRDKAVAALGWPGRQRVELPDLDGPIVVQRDLDLKLTLRDGALEAKCYLSYCATWPLFES